MQIVVASAAAGIDPPTGPVSTDFRDLDAYRAGTQALKRMGFGSRSAIHPAQVEIVNEVFTPSADELARARRLVELSDAAGGGVCVDDEGRMVDEAVVRSARHTIATANG
jgi:citrate lyase subunit beta/citryl-CoA lyase